MNKGERVLKYINSSDDFVVNGKRYCENDFYNDVEDLVKENKQYREGIEKAIEYIRSNDIEVLKYHDIPSETTSYEIVTIDLLKILKGGENE